VETREHQTTGKAGNGPSRYPMTGYAKCKLVGERHFFRSRTRRKGRSKKGRVTVISHKKPGPTATGTPKGGTKQRLEGKMFGWHPESGPRP